VREAALTLLERRIRTRSDLAKRLRGRGFRSHVIDSVLDRLSEVGLVDDRAYAEAFLRDRLRFRPRSRRMLRVELLQRGVGEADIEAAFESLADELDEVRLAGDLLARRAARWSRLEPAERRRRAEGLLQRNGFSWDVIRAALAADNLGGDEPLAGDGFAADSGLSAESCSGD
jgi:regulatory protein